MWWCRWRQKEHRDQRKVLQALLKAVAQVHYVHLFHMVAQLGGTKHFNHSTLLLTKHLWHGTYSLSPVTPLGTDLLQSSHNLRLQQERSLLSPNLSSSGRTLNTSPNLAPHSWSSPPPTPVELNPHWLAALFRPAECGSVDPSRWSPNFPVVGLTLIGLTFSLLYLYWRQCH